jgi:hypothetical protein
MCDVGERAERSFGVPMATVADGWRPSGCLRHEQPPVTTKSLVVDTFFESILSMQLRSRRIADWPLCATCLGAQRRARRLCVLVTIADLGFIWFLFAHATDRSTMVQILWGLLFVSMFELSLALWRRALMPALSAGLRLSRDCRTLVVKARPSSRSTQVELHEVGAGRWY